MNKNIVIIPKTFKTSFEEALLRYRILFLGAFTGCGKTTVCAKILSDRDALFINADNLLQSTNLKNTTSSIIAIDNLHTLQNDEQVKSLLKLLHEKSDKQFLLISRANMPELLVNLEMSGELYKLNADYLRFGSEETSAIFSAYSYPIFDKVASFISKTFYGNPMAIALLAKRSNINEIKNIENSNELAQIKWDVYRYLNANIFADLDKQSADLLLCMAEFENFTVDLLQDVTGYKNLQSIVMHLVDSTFFVNTLGNDLYCCAYDLIDFFKWKSKQTLPEKLRIDFSNKTAEHYFSHKDYVKAIFYFQKAQNNKKVIELLEICALLNPAIGFFKELEPYYNELSEETILNSGSLIAGMAMLCILHVDYEGADDWYFKLREKAQTLNKNTAEYKKLQEKIIYLDLASPHRDASSLQEIFTTLFKNLKFSGMKMTQLSITSCLPTVLNGGRDFSEWVKKDDIIYHVMKKPIEYVLDSQAVGLAECAYCESKFEKCVAYHIQQVQMISTFNDIQHRGTIHTEFAAVGLLSRIQLSQGKANSARDTLLQFAERIPPKDTFRLMPNLRALLCHIALCCGDLQEVEHWFAHESPEDLTNIWILWRLQYRVKVEVLIYKGHYDEAIVLLSQLLNYAEKCKKILDFINFNVLIAIAYFRMSDKEWQNALTKALNVSLQYEYVQPIAQYGKAILPLLLEIKYICSKQGKTQFDKIVKHTRTQASFYQNYLQANYISNAKLSKTELQVLALICQDKSNQEIADILGIKLTTVKTHVSNILRKLEIKRRNEAKTVAKKQNLIENYLTF